MGNNLIQKIVAVINALNNVSVKGEQNLANLSGSITILKEVVEEINNGSSQKDAKHKNKE